MVLERAFTYLRSILIIGDYMISFHSYNGLAGDEHLLLVGEENGRRFDTLFNRMYFPNWSLKRAKKRIERMFEDFENEKLLAR